MSTNVKIVEKNLKNFNRLALAMKMLSVQIVIHLDQKGCFQHSVHQAPVLGHRVAEEAVGHPVVHSPERSKFYGAVASM